MSHKFNAGDLAIMIGSTASDLIGCTVELVEFLGAEPDMEFVAEDYLRIALNTGRNAVWVVRLVSRTYRANSASGHSIDTAYGPCREQWLMPLRRDTAPAAEKAQAVPA